MARRPVNPQRLSGINFGQPAPQGRAMRHPQHHFQVRTPPWVIQPVAIAPVLPGDTLERARIQARVVTDPIRSKLCGWWTELHLFYVKHRDTTRSNEFQQMVLEPGIASGMPTVSGSAGPTYSVHGRPDYTALCLEAVVNSYFRDQGDVLADYVEYSTGLPLAKLGRSDWSDSLTVTADITAVDVNVDLNANATIMASEVEAALAQYNWLRDNQLVNMTYEDFLATYGVRSPRVQEHRPELLRSIREWSYPTNTVTQGTGAVTSACVWSIAESVDKKRFITEPGFLFMVSVTKPKVYRSRQNGSMSNHLDDAYTWLPAVLRDDPNTSLVDLPSVIGGLAHTSHLTFDARDLFLYGDQFLASAPSVMGGGTVAGGALWAANNSAETNKFGTVTGLNAEFRPDYPLGSQAERNNVFAGTTNEVSLIQVEGVITFDVASSIIDTTPGVPDRS